jgi:hypothetical protein
MKVKEEKAYNPRMGIYPSRKIKIRKKRSWMK